MSDWTDPMHSVKTVCDEGNAFVQRHNLDGPAASVGSLVWGSLRALYECPKCAGHFRVPKMAQNVITREIMEVLVCPNCNGIWVYAPENAEKTQNKRRKSTRKS